MPEDSQMPQAMRVAARITSDDLKLRLRLEAAIRGLSINRTVAELLDERMRSADELADRIRQGGAPDAS